MIEKYKSDQPIVYQILANSLNNNKISHAYLFDILNYSNGYNFIMDFIKDIICSNLDDSSKKNDIINAIEDGNYPDIKIIKPDGQWIKKDQLEELQQEFSTKSIYNNKKIYIIMGAEYLNTSSANSILKFLEEPADNIIAILITRNINNVLTTIKSRCQNFTLSSIEKTNNCSSVDKITSFLLSEQENIINDQMNISDYINQVVKFAVYYEKNKLYILTHTYSLWFVSFNDKPKNILALNILLLFYKDVVNNKLGRNFDFFDDYFDDIKNIALQNTCNNLYNMINLIIEAIDKNKININLNLNIDNLIMEMENCYD